MHALRPKLSGTARRSPIKDLIVKVVLRREFLKRFPHDFSGGQRQRIAMAPALGMWPQLIVCDEPTFALDVSVQAQILNLLRELGTSSAWRTCSSRTTSAWSSTSLTTSP